MGRMAVCWLSTTVQYYWQNIRETLSSMLHKHMRVDGLSCRLALQCFCLLGSFVFHHFLARFELSYLNSYFENIATVTITQWINCEPPWDQSRHIKGEKEPSSMAHLLQMWYCPCACVRVQVCICACRCVCVCVSEHTVAEQRQESW